MSYPVIQFVDSPASTATVRYDCNSSTATCRTLPLGGGDLDLGVPAFTGEPEGVGVDYGYRSIQFVQRIIGTKAVALARMSVLAKELLRSTNWLRFQLDSTVTPVYFKTYRTEPGALSLEWSETAQAWDITVPLVAEGFAYGPKVTLSQVQIVQGPTDLTTPTRYAMRYVLPTITGDAPTPLRVSITPASSSVAAANRATWLVGVSSGTSSMVSPVIEIGTSDGFTAGTGTAAATADANYSNGSYRTVTISSGASNFLERLSGTFPVEPLGRYKVLLRCEADSPSATARQYLFGLGYTTATGVTYARKTRLIVGDGVIGASTFQGWVDLGEFHLPIATQAPTDAVTSTGMAFSLGIGTADAGSGTVRVDAFKLIPVDGPTVTNSRLMYAVNQAGYTAFAGGNRAGVFDADLEAAWQTNSGTITSWVPSLNGAYPIADPAAEQNILHVIAADRGIAASFTQPITALNAQSALDVSYNPRYLYVGNGS